MKIFTKIIFFAIFISIGMMQQAYTSEKIKIGLLVPLSGENAHIGNSIIKSIQLAVNKIDNRVLEIFPKDTKNDPNITLQAAKDLNEQGVKIVIGPIFNKNLIYLDELQNMTFISLTNKTLGIPKNVISAGINSISQINAIIKFQKLKELKTTIFLLPKSYYEDEIKRSIKKTKIKIKQLYIYDTDPTKLTKKIEDITKYRSRQLDLKREIEKLTNSDDPNNEKKIAKLEKMDTIGKVNFDSVIIADFDENLKSITTSLLYVDVYPKEVFFITLNQWFDSSLLKEKNSQPLYFPSIDYKNYKKFSEVVKPDVINIDYNVDPISICKKINIPVQGGLDPKILLTNTENLKKQTLKYLNIFKDHPYIFNLGHGVLPETNPNMIDYLVKTVKDY